MCAIGYEHPVYHENALSEGHILAFSDKRIIVMQKQNSRREIFRR